MLLPRLIPVVDVGVDELGVLGAGCEAVERDVEGRAGLEDGRPGEVPGSDSAERRAVLTERVPTLTAPFASACPAAPGCRPRRRSRWPRSSACRCLA